MSLVASTKDYPVVHLILHAVLFQILNMVLISSDQRVNTRNRNLTQFVGFGVLSLCDRFQATVQDERDIQLAFGMGQKGMQHIWKMSGYIDMNTLPFPYQHGYHSETFIGRGMIVGMIQERSCINLFYSILPTNCFCEANKKMSMTFTWKLNYEFSRYIFRTLL